ncbi:MAG: formyltetrahydrofolate deformylase [Microbacteriaceae bacterium]
MTITYPTVGAETTEVTVEHVLTLDCPEAPGIVRAVSGYLYDHGCDIIDNKQFGDRRSGHFFMRLHLIRGVGASGTQESSTVELRAGFESIAEQFGMRWDLQLHGAKKRVLIMVSKYGHCLNDLLFRARTGDLPIEVVAVVSNHLDHERMVDWYGIPYFHVPVTAQTKPAAEARLLELVDEYQADLVVLARYMQVLSDQLCTELSGRAINIHHSFLPSFKGARPYQQAYERGVKLVGASAHYVTGDLDEGPIIAQQVINVDHTLEPKDLVAVGRDAETAALTEAVRWHCEGRVIIQGRRTVVLR